VSDVRIRLDLDGVRLEYSGSQEFFERVVEPFVAAASHRHGAGGEPPPTPAHSEAPEEREEPAVEEAPSPPPAPPPAPAGYRPPSYEFGVFVRQLGREAGDPDKQVVAFAFFLWNYVKKETIREDEIAGCFHALGLAMPEDMRTLYDGLANRLRFLAPGPEAGAWQLTTKGANYVRTRLLAPRGELA
jgi:hypothetical protein